MDVKQLAHRLMNLSERHGDKLIKVDINQGEGKPPLTGLITDVMLMGPWPTPNLTNEIRLSVIIPQPETPKEPAEKPPA